MADKDVEELLRAYAQHMAEQPEFKLMLKAATKVWARTGEWPDAAWIENWRKNFDANHCA